ncbi:hypothetical protein D9758_005718 [Tetrapyrgos nigripes]|uniref:Uncharacterized protein n=1 Tax=Tetrapyrgos nigripes TaxID=182062 RepID=A0A8H5LR18_9AGAR|nr:hypothetical protein D9758_005718 [Tetrapyrgos nigripes]
MQPSGGPVDIFSNSSDVQTLRSSFTVAGSQSKIIFERDYRPDPNQNYGFSRHTRRQDEMSQFHPPFAATQSEAPMLNESDSDHDEEAVNEHAGMSVLAGSASVNMVDSDVTAIKGFQHVQVLSNQMNPNLVHPAWDIKPSFATDHTTGPGYVSALNENRHVDAWAPEELRDNGFPDMRKHHTWASQSYEGSRGNIGSEYCRSQRHQLKTVLILAGLPRHPLHNPRASTMPGPKRGSLLSRRSTSSEPLGQTHFFDGSNESRLSQVSVLRTGTDRDRVHHVHQSQPGSASSFPGPGAGQNHTAQDPRSLIQDKRDASQLRRDASHGERDVHLFSNSRRADVRETTFHVTDRSEGAIEMPSRPTPEYTRALQAVVGHRSRNTTGAVPPATGPVLSMTGPAQPPYVATGPNVPGYHQPAHPTHGYSHNYGLNGAYPAPNYPPPHANYAPTTTMGYGSPMAYGHHAPPPGSPPPPPSYPYYTSGQSSRPGHPSTSQRRQY